MENTRINSKLVDMELQAVRFLKDSLVSQQTCDKIIKISSQDTKLL